MKTFRFRIQTASGGIVSTSARGRDIEEAKFHLFKQYKNCVIMEAREG